MDASTVPESLDSIEPDFGMRCRGGQRGSRAVECSGGFGEESRFLPVGEITGDDQSDAVSLNVWGALIPCTYAPRPGGFSLIRTQSIGLQFTVSESLVD